MVESNRIDLCFRLAETRDTEHGNRGDRPVRILEASNRLAVVVVARWVYVYAVDTLSLSGVSMTSEIAIGSSAPLGATVKPDGVNFSVYSKSASQLELLLFDNQDDINPARVIALDAQKNRTYHY